MARINSSGSSVPSTNNTTTDPYIPYLPLSPTVTLPSLPMLAPQYVSLELLLYLVVAYVYRLEPRFITRSRAIGVVSSVRGEKI